MKIAVVKYNAGNTRSVTLALERLGVEATITKDHEVLQAADKVIFPGVGQAGSAMNSLREQNLDQVISNLTQPVLGICLGMQLLCESSEEGSTQCLGIIPEQIKKFTGHEKIPHTGWNKIYDLKTPLFKMVNDSSYCYFVHSYYAPLSKYTIASCEYILKFSVALQHRNFYGVQFHPEKSGENGTQILKNFLAL